MYNYTAVSARALSSQLLSPRRYFRPSQRAAMFSAAKSIISLRRISYFSHRSHEKNINDSSKPRRNAVVRTGERVHENLKKKLKTKTQRGNVMYSSARRSRTLDNTHCSRTRRLSLSNCVYIKIWNFKKYPLQTITITNNECLDGGWYFYELDKTFRPLF